MTQAYPLLFESLVQALPSPILIIDSTLMILHANEAALRLSDRQGTLVGQTLQQVFKDAGITNLAQVSVQTSSVRRGGYSRGGPAITWNVAVTPLRTSTETAQEYSFFLVTIENITEMQRLEQVQRDFIANISHELRTPLTSYPAYRGNTRGYCGYRLR